MHESWMLSVVMIGADVGDVVEASFAQQQPPLDAVANSLMQRLGGVGDMRQRALSVLAGFGSLFLLGGLALRAGLGAGSAAAVLTLAVSPVLVGVTAYARPYALPLFLMLAFLYLTDAWLSSANRWAVPGILSVAILLPLSRAAEPSLFLGIVVGVLAVAWWFRRADPWSGTPAVPIAAAVVGILAVALPVISRLSTELAAYTESGSISVLDHLFRIWQDIPDVARLAIPALPVVLTLFLLMLVIPHARRMLIGIWWAWVLLAVPAGFIVVFFLRTPLDQTYYQRHTFSWIPAIAIVIGVGTFAAVERRSKGELLVPVIVGTLLLVVLGASSIRLGQNLSRVDLPDWRAASSLISAETSNETVVVFDSVRKLGLYRTPFAGRPRYTGTSRMLPSSLRIAANPESLPEDTPAAVMLLGRRPEVEGWTAISTDELFTLYVPDETMDGRVEVALALLEFADALGPDNGAALALAAIAILEQESEEDAALAATTALLAQSDTELRNRIEAHLRKFGLSGRTKS